MMRHPAPRFRRAALAAVAAALFIIPLGALTAAIRADDDPFTGPDARRHVARERSADFLHIRADIEVDLVARTIAGRATLTLEPLAETLGELTLDCSDLTVRGVTDADGGALPHRLDDGRLHITCDPPLRRGAAATIVIDYEGKPRNGLHFNGPDDGYPAKPRQAYTQGEPEHTRFWLPCHDYPNDRATSEMVVTVKRPYRVISNGALLEVTEDEARDTRTFHWKEEVPHVSYLISLVIGEYEEIVHEWKGIPVTYYVHPDDVDRAERSFGRTVDMMEWFSERIGIDYPYEKYAQSTVHDFMFGGMENISATTQTQNTLHEERSRPIADSDGLVAHELVHQWFGDLLTCRSWPHIWLNEGFATYFTALWFEHDRGADEFAYGVLGLHRASKGEDRDRYRRPIVQETFVDPIDLFDRHTYSKGGSVLHMLRFVLGDEGFWKGIRLYARRHQVGLVETDDLRRAMEDATGRDLGVFFRQWLHGAGHPEYRVSWTWNPDTQLVAVSVRQTQPEDGITPVFEMPVVIQVVTDERAVEYRVEVRERSQVFHLPAASRPRLVRFDRGGHIIKEVEFEKGRDELLWQLRHDTDLLGRIQAIEWLKETPPFDEGYEALAGVARPEGFWGLRVEATRVLGEWGGPPAIEPLLELAADPDPRVRRAAVAALGESRDRRALAAVRGAFEGDDNDYVEAEAARALGRLASGAGGEGREALKRLLVAGIGRPSHNDVLRSGIVSALAEIGDDDLLPTILAEMEYGKPRESRQAAVAATASWAARDPRVRRRVAELLEDREFRVRRAAANLLGDAGARDVIEDLERMAATDLDGRGRERARAAIRRIEGQEPDRREAGLEAELERLRRLVRELEGRLRALERRPAGVGVGGGGRGGGGGGGGGGE